jgi:thiamine biosynthesis lipoprotein
MTAAANFPPQLHRFAHDAMACTFELGLVADDRSYADQAAHAAFDELDRLERELSRFVPHSDIAQLNTLAVGAALQVGIDTIACLRCAAALHDLTGGAFDINFRARQPDVPPTPPLLLDPTTRTITALAPLDLDLGGLGKGYALDCIVTLLADWDVRAGVLHSGQSTVRTFGRPPDTDTWRIHLRLPNDAPRQHAPRIDLASAALAGSGQILHGTHIIDPATGTAVPTQRATWAIAPDAATADALSTALMVMPPAAIERLCAQRPDVAGILIPDTAAPELLRFGCVPPLHTED